LTESGPHDGYKEILDTIRCFNHSQHTKSRNLCLITKLNLILTLNDPHDT